MQPKIAETYLVNSPDQAVVLLNPLRSEILSRLVEPASAAEVARMIHETPQRINYHFKALEKVGLARKVGTRQVRNLVEVLYQSIARTFILADSLGWQQDDVQRMKDQGSLAHLITASERMKRDAYQLMEHSEDNVEIPSASINSIVYLKDPSTRNAFMEEYMQCVNQLLAKYSISANADANANTNADVNANANVNTDTDTDNNIGVNTNKSTPYQVLLAIYPEPAEGGSQDE